MLPWTRGLRKEFLPLYDRGGGGAPILKPVAHLAMESLVSAGAEEITLVVCRRDLPTVRHYFSIDREFILRHQHHAERLTETQRFYRQLEKLRLHYAIQERPRGFGDAVLQAERTVGGQPFLLHAADATLLEPERGRILRSMASLREREELDAVLLVRDRWRTPAATGSSSRPAGREGGLRRLEVVGLEEKPERPRSHWAATAVYALSPRIFSMLRAERAATHPRELELTAGLARMRADGGRLSALVLSARHGEWRSVGSPTGYRATLARTWARAGRPPAPSKAPARPRA